MLADLEQLKCAPYPFTVYVCSTEEEWDSIKDEVGSKYDSWRAGGAACCRTLTHVNAALICIDHRDDPDYTAAEFCGLCVHESVHAFQALCDLIGETSPSIEFEAYTIQAISNFVIQFCWSRRASDDEKTASEGEESDETEQLPLPFDEPGDEETSE